MKVGAAFTNRDGSLTAVLDAFPASTNRLQIREQRFPEEARPGTGRQRRRTGTEEEART